MSFVVTLAIFIGIGAFVAYVVNNKRPTRPGPELPPLVPGQDFAYTLGSGYGHVKFNSYGTHLSAIQQKYFTDKGPYMAREFQKITGYGPPAAFYYEVNYYANKSQFISVVGRKHIKKAGVCFWPSPGKVISQIHVTDNVDVVTHEMVHAITFAAYGPLPLFMNEGMAEWFAHTYRKRTPNPIHFYRTSAQIATQAVQINEGSFPSMAAYLKCEDYDDWKRLFGGDYFDGYPVGAILTDWLLRNHHSWTIQAMRHCHENGTGQAERSRLFSQYAERTWPGGFPGMDRQLRAYILERAQRYGR